MIIGSEGWAMIHLEGSSVSYTKNIRVCKVSCGQTIMEAVTALDIPTRQSVIALVNGLVADMSYQLKAGDVVRLIPQITGG